MNIDELREQLSEFFENDLETDINAEKQIKPEDQSQFKDSTYTIISTVAYLIGVPEHIFTNEHEPPKYEIYTKLETDKNAKIIRNLCRLRTIIERNFKKINILMTTEFKTLSTIPDIVPTEIITQLTEEGVMLRGAPKLSQHIIDINRLITDRINNCRELFPIWINWDYIRDMFIMPNGLTDAGTKEAAQLYYANRSCYPYQMYINWKPSEEGNILFEDKKFVKLLYSWHGDEFTDYSKVSDASAMTKNYIYDFIEDSGKTVFVVDCENSDPYKFCATLKNLDEEYSSKIAKIILVDDVNAATGWTLLKTYIDIPVTHILIERIKMEKSLVDVKLTAETCKEHYANNVDSFVLVSSDSDYWGLISSMPEAKFLVMLEYNKTGPDIKTALFNSGIFFCYMDDFYSGNSEDIKIHALLREAHRYLEHSIHVNINTMMETAYRATRIEMTDSEKQRFYNKYIKPMTIEIDEQGNLSIRLKRGK